MITQTSPTLHLPMVDERCTMSHIGTKSDCGKKDTYRLVGSCSNCHSRIVGMFTVGHEAHTGWNSPACPVCQCTGQIYRWDGLEDAVQQHELKPDGRGQGMRVCVNCGQTEPEAGTPCKPRQSGDERP